MLFKSYQEAHEKLNLPGSYQLEINGAKKEGISSLKLTDHVDSYNRCTHSGRVIYYIGEGRRKSPGHPAGNQMENKQEIFRQSWSLQNLIPLLHKRSDDTVALLGYYRVYGMRKRMGYEGFTYFEFELRKETKQDLSEGLIVSCQTSDRNIPLLPSSPANTPVASSAASVTTHDLPPATTSGLACHRCNIIKNLFD